MYTTDLPTIKVTVLRDREAHTETADPSSRELTVIRRIAGSLYGTNQGPLLVGDSWVTWSVYGAPGT